MFRVYIVTVVVTIMSFKNKGVGAYGPSASQKEQQQKGPGGSNLQDRYG